MEHAAGRDPYPSHRLFWIALILGSALSVAVGWMIATQSLSLGSLEGNWYYGYLRPFSMPPIGAAFLVCGICSTLLLFPGLTWLRHEWVLVAAWILAATCLHALIRSLTPLPFERIFISDAANSFYSVTQAHDAGTVLRNFDEVRASSPIHAQSNMPGKLMLLYGLQLISARPVVLAWLIVLISNIGGALMYAFVRNTFDDRRVALYSLVLYLFVPSRVFFFPLLNTLTPVVLLCCAWLLLLSLQTGRATYAALLGAALYGLVFFEPLPLVMGLLFAGLLVRAVVIGHLRLKQVPGFLAAGIMGFATPYAAMRAVFGFDMIDAFRQIGAHAVEFNAVSARPYSIWVIGNLREFVLGMGACQAVTFWAALVHGFQAPGSWRARLTRPITIVCVSLLATLGAIDLIGVNRGEVIRLWIFLACFFQIPTAYVCARLPGHTAILLVLATTALQAALGTAMIGFIITE